MKIDIRRLPHAEGLPLPAYQTEGAAGMDLISAADLVIPPGMTVAVPTGLCMAIPPGWELQVRSRSGLALRENIVVANSPGTIDSDFRGEVCVILHNRGNMMMFQSGGFIVSRGDRIAQAVLCPVQRVSWREVDELDATARGTGGFGSTGRRA